MRYNYGTLVGGPFTQGVDRHWDWVKDGGGYHQNSDFFSVHWEVQERDPSSVRLHVEAPRHEADPFLNGLKQELVAALLASDVADLARQRGCDFRTGTRTTEAAVRRNKSTEAFRIIWKAPGRLTIEQRIEAVHETIGARVAEVVASFSARLNAHFQSAMQDVA